MLIVPQSASLSDESRRTLSNLGMPVENGTLRRLHAVDGKLAQIELEDGRRIAREVLLHAPPQVQTPLVRSLGLALDESGFVVTDETGQTSERGIYAAGDVTSGRQQIALAAAAGLLTAIGMDRALAQG
jgi:thioredoxin reductase